jgi:hypothetical protein
VLDPYKLVLAPVYTGWRAVGWVWLPTAKNVAEFLAEEARLHRLPLEASERLIRLAKAAIEFEDMFFEGGEEDNLGYYVMWRGHTYKVYVVVGYNHEYEPIIEAIDIEEWVSVAKAKRLAKTR